MRAVTAITVGIVILAHAIVGCCWHHAHEGVCCSRAVVQAAKPIVHGDHVHSTATHSCDCEHGDHDSNDKTPACHEQTCVYVRAEHQQWVESPIDGLVFAIAWPEGVAHAGGPDVRSFASDGDQPQFAVPLHLLHRVLLI